MAMPCNCIYDRGPVMLGIVQTHCRYTEELAVETEVENK